MSLTILPNNSSERFSRDMPHPKKIISLEGTVQNYSEQSLSNEFSPPKTHLVLEMKESNNDGFLRGELSRYSQHYSRLAMNFGNYPLVNEIYDSLKQGKKASFNGKLVIYKDSGWWHSVVYGRLVGDLTIGDLNAGGKSYEVSFFSHPNLGESPRLEQISRK